MSLVSDPLVSLRTELLVARDDARRAEQAYERERRRVDGALDRRRDDAAKQAAAVAYIRAVAGDDAAQNVRSILSGVTSFPGAADAGRSAEDYANDLRTAKKLAQLRNDRNITSATELVQVLRANEQALTIRLSEAQRVAGERVKDLQRAHAAVAQMQMTLDDAATDALLAMREKNTGIVERIRHVMRVEHIARTAREEEIHQIIRNDDASHADRARYELAQAEATVARLQREYPADIR